MGLCSKIKTVLFIFRSGERGTVARTVMRGKAITGAGGSHDEACEALKDEVQRHLINLKVNRLFHQEFGGLSLNNMRGKCTYISGEGERRKKG